MAKRVIQAVALPRQPEKEANKLKDLAAKVAYYYPQYTYEDALDLDIRQTLRLLRTVSVEQATDRLYLTQIVAAPHTKKGEGVKKLVDNFKKVIGG